MVTRGDDMMRYEQVDGGEAYISDTAVIGFIRAMENLTAVLTAEGRVIVRGKTSDLHDAWKARMDKRTESQAISSAMRQ
jgi:hypothetical protein